MPIRKFGEDFSIADVVGIKNYPEETAELAGVETKLAELREGEVEILINMLDKYIYKNSAYAIRSLVAENADLIIDLVRAVKAETKQEFAGPRGRGNALTIIDLTADVFKYVWGATGATSWEASLSTTGKTAYIGTETNAESVAEEEGMIILGFVDDVPTPKVNKVLLTKNGDPYPYNNLIWKANDDFPLAALPEPYIMTPETTFYIYANVYTVGVTRMEPIGFKVLQAKNILSF